MKKTYQELKAELHELLQWFEQDDLDIDQAMQKHADAEKLIAQLKEYLDETEQKIKKVTAS